MRAPDEANLGRETDWASDKYDHKILGRNDRSGFLGEYQPLAHYLPKQEFERLGDRFDRARIPVWR